MNSIFIIEAGVMFIVKKQMKWKIRKLVHFPKSIYPIGDRFEYTIWSNLKQNSVKVFQCCLCQMTHLTLTFNIQGEIYHLFQIHDVVLVLNRTLKLYTNITCSFCKHLFEISHQAQILPSKSIPHITLQELSSQPGSNASY